MIGKDPIGWLKHGEWHLKQDKVSKRGREKNPICPKSASPEQACAIWKNSQLTSTSYG
jgi:hypothetical protein